MLENKDLIAKNIKEPLLGEQQKIEVNASNIK